MRNITKADWRSRIVPVTHTSLAQVFKIISSICLAASIKHGMLKKGSIIWKIVKY